jgi:hypothetical protein
VVARLGDVGGTIACVDQADVVRGRRARAINIRLWATLEHQQ